MTGEEFIKAKVDAEGFHKELKKLNRKEKEYAYCILKGMTLHKDMQNDKPKN